MKLISLFTQLLNQNLSKLFLLFFLLVPVRLSFAVDNEFSQLREIANRYATNPNLIEEEIATAVINKISNKLSANQLDFKFWSFDDENVKKLINSLAEKNIIIRGVIANIYEQRLLTTIINNKADKLDLDYSTILKYRPDPNEKNNQLRETILLKAKGESTKLFAQARLEEIKYLNRYNLPLKIKLYFAGFYGRTSQIAPICLMIIALLAINFLFFYNPTKAKLKAKVEKQLKKSKKKQTPVRQSVEKVYAGGQTTLERGQTTPDKTNETYSKKPSRPPLEKNFDRGYKKAAGQDDEYSRLLSFFELDDQASENEIKKAYRDRVKNLHPDKKFDSPNTNSDEFMEIKQAYNRIMEIRSSWFGQK